jgi:hypothetical protein
VKDVGAHSHAARVAHRAVDCAFPSRSFDAGCRRKRLCGIHDKRHQ